MYHTSKFIDYCMEFYGKDGLYPIKGITPKKIKEAICEISLSSGFHRFDGGDTIDRERVIDFILMDMEVKQRMKDKLRKMDNESKI